MRIGFDAKRAFMNSRGLGNYSRTLLESLEKYYPENECFLFTPKLSGTFGQDWYKKHPHFKIVLPQGFGHQIFRSAWRSFFIKNDLIEKQLDIYHGLSHELPFGIEKLNIKKIVTVHDLIFMRYPQYFPWIDRQVYLKKLKHSCEIAHIIVSICEQTKRDLIKFLNIDEKRIEVVYQSCHQRFYSSQNQEKTDKVSKKFKLPEKYILTVGALEKRKNFLNLIKAYSLGRNQFKDYKLLIVGKGEGKYKKEMLDFIRENNLKDHIRFLENVPHGDLPCIYQKSSLFVFPSHFEGFGLPIVEAIFSETPVITSKGSFFGETAGDSAIYIDPDKPEDISFEMARVLKDPDLVRSMIRKGRSYVEKFHRRNTSLKMMSLYKRLF